jgi:hypothetical protein
MVLARAPIAGISKPGPLLGVELSRAVTVASDDGSSALDPKQNI